MGYNAGHNQPSGRYHATDWNNTITPIVAAIEKNDGFSYFKVTGPPASGKMRRIARAASVAAETVGKRPIFIVPTLLEKKFVWLSAEEKSVAGLVITWEDIFTNDSEQFLEAMDEAGTTIIVKLDGQRTLYSDFGQLVIRDHIYHHFFEKTKGWACTLVVMSSFGMHKGQALGRLAFASTDLGYNSAACEEAEAKLSLPFERFEAGTDISKATVELVIKAASESEVITILSFLPVRVAVEAIVTAHEAGWQVCYLNSPAALRSLQRQCRSIPQKTSMFVMSDLTPGLTTCSVDLPNLRYIIATDRAWRFYFDDDHCQTMKDMVGLSRMELYHQIGYLRKTTDPRAVIYGDFDLSTALKTRPWRPEPASEDQTPFEFLYTFANMCSDVAMEDVAIEMSYQYDVLDHVHQMLTLMDILEEGTTPDAYQVKEGWPEKIADCLVGGDAELNVDFFSAAMLAQTFHGFENGTLDEDETRVLIRLAAIMDVAMSWTADETSPPLIKFKGSAASFKDESLPLILDVCGGITKELFPFGALWQMLGIWDTYRVKMVDFMSSNHGVNRLFTAVPVNDVVEINPGLAEEVYGLVLAIEKTLNMQTQTAFEGLPALSAEKVHHIEVILARSCLPHLAFFTQERENGAFDYRCVAADSHVTVDSRKPKPAWNWILEPEDYGKKFYLVYHHLKWADDGVYGAIHLPTAISTIALKEAVGNRSLEDLASRFPQVGMLHRRRM
ncbi:hypothetical protein CGCSCA4_v012169 [Colletotrichum siamense]|uniref:Uncharacterized protein n=1 Tax=Colletotrichum siamense TaxID=690259 RepID=A0A9P5BU97_COLSI|nr:hypothetical protein CGCSCA4_v012169 [Colletotrichum siamense]KAF4850782.1 hypothetical protein CGCSCA2_v011260 [Colletotrichum siamense]